MITYFRNAVNVSDTVQHFSENTHEVVSRRVCVCDRMKEEITFGCRRIRISKRIFSRHLNRETIKKPYGVTFLERCTQQIELESQQLYHYHYWEAKQRIVDINFNVFVFVVFGFLFLFYCFGGVGAQLESILYIDCLSLVFFIHFHLRLPI